MRVAALYDIHANLPALEAVLADVRQTEADLVVVGGDVLPGPMPAETVALLQNLDLPTQFIYGNGEVAVLEDIAGRATIGVPESYRPVIAWMSRQLSADQRQFIASWPATFCVNNPGFGDVLFCHATPRNESEIFTRLTSETKLVPVFRGVGESTVICGHTHMQFDRMVGNVRVVNAGSVGMPFGRQGADWLLLGDEGVEFRHTSYDLARAADAIRNTNYPQAEEFAVKNILQSPTEAEMLAAFSRAELK